MHRIRQADHPSELLHRHPTAIQLPSCGIGTIGGKLPVGVIRPRPSERGTVGMAADTDVVGHSGQGLGQLTQDLTGVVTQLGTTQIEHRAVTLVDDLDAQTLAGDIQQQLILELRQRRGVLDLLAQLLHQLIQLGLFVDQILRLLGGWLLHRLPLPPGEFQRTTELDHAGTRPTCAGDRAGILEIIRDSRPLLRAGGTQ